VHTAKSQKKKENFQKEKMGGYLRGAGSVIMRLYVRRIIGVTAMRERG